WANAKFACPSASAFNRARYVSYAPRLSHDIRAHATLLVPSRGRKSQTREPPHRGMMRPQFSAYSLKASRWKGSISYRMKHVIVISLLLVRVLASSEAG